MVTESNWSETVGRVAYFGSYQADGWMLPNFALRDDGTFNNLLYIYNFEFLSNCKFEVPLFTTMYLTL